MISNLCWLIYVLVNDEMHLETDNEQDRNVYGIIRFDHMSYTKL